MKIEDVIYSRRSIRRFKETSIDIQILTKIAQCGALYPSRGNKQPLEFLVINELCSSELVFENILWGSKISSYKVFSDKNYAPKAYIVVLVNEQIMPLGYEYEVGAAVENILLCATAYELGSVWIKSINKVNISKHFNLPSHIKIDSVIALGYPAHKSSVIEFEDDPTTVLDTDCNLYVPKKSFSDIINYNSYEKN